MENKNSFSEAVLWIPGTASNWKVGSASASKWRLYPDPDPHQFADDKPKATGMENEPIWALFQGFGPFLEANILIRIKLKGRIEIRIRIKVTSRIRTRIRIKLTSRIRIRVKVKSRIRIRIKMTSRIRILNTAQKGRNNMDQVIMLLFRRDLQAARAGGEVPGQLQAQRGLSQAPRRIGSS